MATSISTSAITWSGMPSTRRSAGMRRRSETATVRPSDFHHLPDHLFRNDGGRFVDVTSKAGINDWHGQGLGVVATDLDDDGRVDLFVANDQSPNFCFVTAGA